MRVEAGRHDHQLRTELREHWTDDRAVRERIVSVASPRLERNVDGESGACGLTDFVGLGRMVLSYPDLPADVLAGRPLQRKQICRTFSDCTTSPSLGLVSGCFHLDPFYVKHQAHDKLKELKGTA